VSLRPLRNKQRKEAFLMNFQEHRELIKKLKRQITEPPSLDILQLLLSELQYTMQDNPDLGADERKYVFSYSGFIKRWSLQRLQQTLDPQWDKLYWDTMLFEARIVTQKISFMSHAASNS